MMLKNFKQLFSKPKIKSSAWDAAGSGRRFFHFQPELGSINNLLSQNLETLRSRSRDMVRKNPYAANIIDTIVSNSIGTGIKPQSKARNGEFRKKVQELWLKWTDEADSSGVSDFYGLQALVCRSMIEGGECFVRLRTRKLEDRFSAINHLNTPFNNQKEITVTDPTHPLFGRTFPISSASVKAYNSGNVLVIYRSNITLRIPFSATNLAGKQDLLTSKLTWNSLYEFVSLAKEYKLCHVNQIECGRKCRNTSSQKF